MSDSWFRFGSGFGPATAAVLAAPFPPTATAAAYPASLTVMQLRHGTQSILEFGAGRWYRNPGIRIRIRMRLRICCDRRRSL